MTNCPGLPGTKEVLNTDKSQFKNREIRKKMGKTGLLWEQLPSSGETLAAVLMWKQLIKKAPHIPGYRVGQGL